MNASHVLARVGLVIAGCMTACSSTHIAGPAESNEPCSVDKPELDACGGEPFGAWRLVDVERGRAECDAGGSRAEPTELLVSFESGGTGHSYAKLADDVEVTDVINWTRTETSLRFDGTAYDYCVDDDELQLSDPEGPTYTLERVFVRQTVIPACEERDADDCEAGEQPSEGCQLGICAGAASCGDIASEASCTTTEGCAWDETACEGQPVARCSLWHYGSMPGCELTDEAPSCAGATRQCRELSLRDCQDHAACAVEPGCIGSTIQCSMVSTCDLIAGCGRDDEGVCTGVSECSEQTTAEQCDAAARGAPTSGCQWVDVCAGDDSPPCEDLSPTRCEDVPGCRLEFPE